ncbi:MAG: sulfotransferase [Myxococcales bacterium FL481]|nr:MAG: sulfotransferase [Myxococcales bacterium FL481]
MSVGAGEVIVVSGLPRSGTSMMMKMLARGGVDVLVDEVRGPDPHNPGGYFELEAVKRLARGEVDWLTGAPGRAVKVVAPLLRYLPVDYNYRVVFMRRRLADTLASQRVMLDRLGHDPAPDGPDPHEAVVAQLDDVTDWLTDQPQFEVRYFSYERVLADPLAAVESLIRFLGRPLDRQRATAVVDPALRRQS